MSAAAKLASVDFDPDHEPTTIAEARNLQRYWRSKRAELERAVAAGKLVPVEQVKELVRQQVGELKVAVMRIPKLVKSRSATLTDRDVAVMESLCADFFDRLTTKTAQFPSATAPASKTKAARPGRKRKGRDHV